MSWYLVNYSDLMTSKFVFIQLVIWSKNVQKLLVCCCYEPPGAGTNTSCFHINYSSHRNLNSSRWYCPNLQPSMDEHLVEWYINRLMVCLATCLFVFLPVSFNLILETQKHSNNAHRNELTGTLFMCANKSELILHQFFMFNEKNWC